MRASSSSSAGCSVLFASAALLAPVAGCIAVDSPPAYAGRDALVAEQVEATKGVMIADTPRSFESSVGRIAVEPLDFDQASLLSPKFSRSVRLTLSGPRTADVICVHESAGSPYPSHFEFAKSGAFACRGVVDSANFRLVVERGCYGGAVTFDETERYTLARGRVTLAGIEAPTDEVSLLDAGGHLVAAFDLVTSMTFRVWSAAATAANQPKPSRARLIVAAAALHDWSHFASQAKLDACQ